jgi:hypothetical protein
MPDGETHTRKYKKKLAGKNARRNIFNPASITKLEQAFENSKQEYINTGHLGRYLNNAKKLVSFYHDKPEQNIDLTDATLVNKIKPKFQVTARTPEDQDTLAKIFKFTFETPNISELNKLSATATNPAPVLTPAQATQVQKIITDSFAALNVNEIQSFPTHLKTLQSKGIDTTAFNTLILDQAQRLTNTLGTTRNISNFTSMLNIFVGLKDILTPALKSSLQSKLRTINIPTKFRAATAPQRTAAETLSAQAQAL